MTVEEISVQRITKTATRELVFLAMVRRNEENEQSANESIVTVNKDETKTEYPMQVQELLNEFSDVFQKELPTGLPPQRQLDHRIELVPRAEPPHRAPYHLLP